MLFAAITLTLLLLVTTSTSKSTLQARGCDTSIPAPPYPEPIEVHELPLPPVTLDETVGGCTTEINPHGTGCIGRLPSLFSGNFLPDNNHVIATLNFTGAPISPNPASIYTGPQVIIIKIDGTTFPNGDSWKCISCGIPEEHQIGRNPAMDYPQAFHDGKRALIGTNIIESDADFASDECTSSNTYIYPIRWNINADGSGPSGAIRELRIHPDNVHLGFNSIDLTVLGQRCYFSRLEFNPTPTTGIPLSPRYDLVNVTKFRQESGFTVDGDQMFFDPAAISVGELRGFSGRGDEVIYIGASVESSNIDVFAANMETGAVRRLTSHPEYTDPIDISSDGEWMVVMDGRGTNRQMWMSGMRGIPPLTDLIDTGATASTRNNGQRRFFNPWIIDKYGDRGFYYGQKVNGAGDGSPGSVNDPQWNGRADPKFSPDGTKIAYWQQITLSPACGGQNPLPCPKSTADGGRVERLMLAHLRSRKPVPFESVATVADTIPWGTPYVPGEESTAVAVIPEGTFSLKGKVSGFANVTIISTADKKSILTVGATYTNYSDDNQNFITGTEKVTVRAPAAMEVSVDWFSNLTSTGVSYSTKVTSPDGFHLDISIWLNTFNSTGTLTTTVDGVSYYQPPDGT